MPRREAFTTKDGRQYPLWADINDLLSAALPAHWFPGRDHRRQHGWMFRGQSNSEWDLIPNLYRAPYNDQILKLRMEYTEAFVDAIRKEGRAFGLAGLRSPAVEQR